MIQILSTRERMAIDELHLELNKRYQVKQVSIFGSFARSEADEDSDLDVLIILLEEVSHRLRNTISDITFEINMKHNTNISLMIFDEKTWSSDIMKLTPIYSEIVRDGVPVYEA